MPATNLTGKRPFAGPGFETGGRKPSRQWLWLAAILAVPLVILFLQSFQPGAVLFVNDTTLGQMKAAPNRLPSAFTGTWHCGGWVGMEGPAVTPTISAILALIFPPEIYLKLYAPFTLFFLGFCAWVFFRQLKFNPAVCLLGGLAAALNMHFFSIACWGLGSWNIAAGMIFLALAALNAKSIPHFWARAVLAGLAVGMNLMEGFDVGAISCVYVGLFVLWQIFTEEGHGAKKVLSAMGTEVLVIFFAAFIAAHAIATLVSTQVEGIVWSNATQTSSTKEERWDPATQWSLPKAETLRVIVPGLFGYRMADRIFSADKSSAYWGIVGEDPRVLELRSDDPAIRADAAKRIIITDSGLSDLLSSDRSTRVNAINRLTKHSVSAARFSGSGEFAGVLVSLLAIFGLVNSWRGGQSPYLRGERRAIWFWGAAALFSLLASWGRYGFVYRLLYQLPYFSNIRNPIKFMHPFHIAWLILAAYGMEALWRRYLQTASPQKWWSGFEKKWTIALLAVIGAALAGVVIYNAEKPNVIDYLVEQGFDASNAIPIAGYSVAAAGWFIFWLALSAGAIAAVMSGIWSGPHARRAWICLGIIILIDLARSDQPWIRYYNYKEAYASNSILDFLQDKPYEHRVTGRVSPKGLGASLNTKIGELYYYWIQNDFPYRGIESLDFAQWPRIPEMDISYMKNFALQGAVLSKADIWPAVRLWELTNTRYIFSLPSIVPLINGQLDSRHQLQIKSFVSIVPKSGVTAVHEAGDVTVVPDNNGSYAFMEYPNALPRAKLYGNWQTPTNDDETLKTLLSHDFDPEQTVLVAQNTPVGQPPGDPKTDAGTVEITDYRPKYVKLKARALTPAVLLLNDRIDPNWKVWVDQKPAPLLRCNYLMRGVSLTPGDHSIEFRFRPRRTTLYVSLCAWGAGILTAGFLVCSRAPAPAPPSPPTPNPQENEAAPAQPARSETPPRPKPKRRR